MNQSLHFRNRKNRILKYGLLWVGVSTVICLYCSISAAQEVPEPPVGPGINSNTQQPVDLRSLSQKELFLYLANEKVVAAGVGFINGQIGDPMASILNIWGEPVKQRQTNILGSIEFLYQPDPNLYIVFTGQETVKTISIKGSPAALFRTVRGARMGVTAQAVANLYLGQEVKVKKNRAEFRQIGINFHFNQNRLEKVVVYSPDD